MPIIISIQYCKFATSDSAIEQKTPRKFQATGDSVDFLGLKQTGYSANNVK